MIKLVFTVHNNYKFLRSPILFFREKKYYKSSQIGGADAARQFYNKSIGLKGKSYVIHNFIDDSCYEEKKYKFRDTNLPLKIIADRSILLAYHEKTSKRTTEYLTSEEYVEKLSVVYK